MTQKSGEQTAEEMFGAQVRQERAARGWTQDQLRTALLDKSGVDLSSTAMTRLEQGRRPIRLNEVAALASLLELDLSRYAGHPSTLLSDKDYERAREELARVDEQEQESRRRLKGVRESRLEEELQLQQEIIAAASVKWRLAISIKEYEERRDG